MIDIRQTQNYILNKFVAPMIQLTGGVNVHRCINQNGTIQLNESLQEVQTYYNNQMNEYSNTFHFTPQIINDITNNIMKWNNLKSLHSHTEVIYGVTMDGRVLTAGTWYMHYRANGYKYDEYLDMHLDTWTNISDIAIGNIHVAGLRNDGRVSVSGFNLYGECNTENWSDIIQVDTGNGSTFGLRKDGIVLYTGRTDCGESEVRKWTDIVSIKVKSDCAFGIKSDGTVVIAGRPKYADQKFDNMVSAMSGWKNIIALDCGLLDRGFIGLQSNGDLIIGNSNLQPLIGQNVIAFSWYGNSYSALKKDGTIVEVSRYGVRQLNNIRVFDNPDSFIDLMNKRISSGKKQAVQIENHKFEVAKRKQEGTCQYCGGKFKGLFSKKCSICRKSKDY